MDMFAAKYEVKYSAAVTCLEKDREALLAFHDFPAEHWQHIRTTEPHRERVRHRPTSNRSQQGLPLAPDGAGDGLQAGDGRQQDLAPSSTATRNCPESSRASSSPTASRPTKPKPAPPPDHAVTHFRP